MKTFKLIILCIISTSVIMISSCSKDKSSTVINTDNGNNNNNNSYFPNVVGTFWIYNNYEIDTLNNTANKPFSHDSTFVAGTMLKLNHTASIFRTISIDTAGISSTTDSYFYTTSTRVFLHSSYFDNMFKQIPAQFQSMFKIQEQWLPVVDNEVNNWLVLNQPIDTSAGINGIPITGNVEVLGSKGNTKTMMIENKTYVAQDYIMTFNFNGTINLGLPISFPIKRISHFYFVEGIGMVENKLENTVIQLPKFGSFDLGNFKTGGNDQVIQKYYIAQ